MINFLVGELQVKVFQSARAFIAFHCRREAFEKS